jgi:hypothetical protein
LGTAENVPPTQSSSTHKGSSSSSASDSKSEWVRALALAHPQLLLVATNRGLLYAVGLPEPTAAADRGCQEVWTLLYEQPAGGPFASMALLGQAHGLVSHDHTRSSKQLSAALHGKRQVDGPHVAKGCFRVALGHIKGHVCLFDLDLTCISTHTTAAAAAAGGHDGKGNRPGGHLQQQLQAPVCVWAAHGGAPVHGVFSSR